MSFALSAESRLLPTIWKCFALFLSFLKCSVREMGIFLITISSEYDFWIQMWELSRSGSVKMLFKVRRMSFQCLR